MNYLNITYNGVSADFPMESVGALNDAEIRNLAIEIVRSGGLRGVRVGTLADSAFDYYVIDRLTSSDGANRIYLRPKVPFG